MHARLGDARLKDARTPGKCTPGKCTPGKCTPGKCTPGKCIFERCTFKRCMSERDIVMGWIGNPIVAVCCEWLIAVDGCLPRLSTPSSICVAWQTRAFSRVLAAVHRH